MTTEEPLSIRLLREERAEILRERRARRKRPQRPWERWFEEKRLSGDDVLAKMEELLALFTTCSKEQRIMQRLMIEAALPIIYGDEFWDNELRLKKRFGVTRLYQELFISCPRQFGKSTNTGIWVACALFAVPSFSCIVFSRSLRQSVLLMQKLRDAFDKLAPRFQFKVVAMNQERIEIEMDGTRRYAYALPGAAESTRGVGAQLIVCDELAYMETSFVEQVVVPLLRVSERALVGLSTQMGPTNHFTRFLRMRAEDGTPLFRQFSFELVCDECHKTGKGATCTHRLTELPPWMSVEKHDRIRRMMGERAFEREMLGLATSSDESAFSPRDVEFLFHAPRVTALDPERHVPWILVAIDPNAGGKGSDCAFVALAPRGDGGATLLGAGAVTARQPEDYLSRLETFLGRLRGVDPALRHANLAVAVENNLKYQAQQIERLVLLRVPRASIVRANDEITANWVALGASSGPLTTHKLKERMYGLTRELLMRSLLRVHERFVEEEAGVMRRLEEQLMDYQVCRRAPDDEPFGRLRVTFSGKANGPDDLAVALQLAVVWMGALERRDALD